MQLEKLTIKNLDNNDEIKVPFNPNQYTIEDSSQWQDQKKRKQLPELQYTGGARKTLTMELFFDTYEEFKNGQRRDVREYTGKIAELLIPTKRINEKKKGKRPPRLQLLWGQADNNTENRISPFVCVLEKVTQKFTLFDSNGTPVRATLNVTFKEFSLPKEELNRRKRARSYPLQTYIVRSGDTLSGIAAELWEDPSQWRRIAKANNIINPRSLSPGQTLEVPAIED